MVGLPAAGGLQLYALEAAEAAEEAEEDEEEEEEEEDEEDEEDMKPVTDMPPSLVNAPEVTFFSSAATADLGRVTSSTTLPAFALTSMNVAGTSRAVARSDLIWTSLSMVYASMDPAIVK